ncbi:hypothetical protein KY321_01395 [Candidatus Woesearchaeota archaeon]|nr:hypothetical protein [Candidatus Woesearchaeota archaeon]
MSKNIQFKQVNDKKDKIINFKVSKDDKKKLVKEAKKAKTSVSEYCRAIVFNHIAESEEE